MTAEELLPALRTWHAHMKAIEDVMDSLGRLVGTQPESPVFEAVFGMAGAYTTSVGVQLGGADGWLEWFWLDCKLGDRPLTAEVGKPVVVNSIEQLSEVIAGDLGRSEQEGQE